MRSIFGEIGSAGGHRSAAKAVIPLKNVRKIINKTSQDKINEWVTELLTKGIKEKAGEEWVK